MYGSLGVAGVYGSTNEASGPRHVGCVVDGVKLLDEPTPLPACANALSELLLAFPRTTPIRFDRTLVNHLYGADACLQAAEHGLTSVAVNAPCLRNAVSDALLPDFAVSAATLARKWRNRLPLVTPSAVIHGDGSFTEWKG